MLNGTDDAGERARSLASTSPSCEDFFASPRSRFSLARVSDRDASRGVRTPELEAAMDGRAHADASALALVVRLDAAREREREVIAFAREQMAECDALVASRERELDHLSRALDVAATGLARARWRLAFRAVVRGVRETREREAARRARARARRLEEQLRKVERYVALAARDFDDLNEKLEREAEAARDARAAERRALEALAAARAGRATCSDGGDGCDGGDAESAAPSTPPTRRAANERRAAAKAACASVAAHVEALLARSPSKQLNDLARAQREAAAAARTALAGSAAAKTSDGTEVDPSGIVALIAVHALERCSERSASDGERAFYRAAKRFESVARACTDAKRSPGHS